MIARAPTMRSNLLVGLPSTRGALQPSEQGSRLRGRRMSAVLVAGISAMIVVAAANASRAPSPIERRAISQLVVAYLAGSPPSCMKISVKISTPNTRFALAGATWLQKGDCSKYASNGFIIATGKGRSWRIVYDGSDLPECGIDPIPAAVVADLLGGSHCVSMLEVGDAGEAGDALFSYIRQHQPWLVGIVARASIERLSIKGGRLVPYPGPGVATAYFVGMSTPSTFPGVVRQARLVCRTVLSDLRALGVSRPELTVTALPKVMEATYPPNATLRMGC